MRRCKLWEAVVLSLGYDPDGFVPKDGKLGTVLLAPFETTMVPPYPAILFARDVVRGPIESRLKIAASNLGMEDGIEAISIPDDGESLAEISLSDFGSWADGVWDDLPKNFPRGKGKSRGSAKPASGPGTKERTTMLTIIAVLASESRIEIAQPHKAAKSIQAAAKAQKLRISERTIAEVLKQIPDALARKGD